MSSIELQQEAELPGMLRNARFSRRVHLVHIDCRCPRMRWFAGVAVLAFWFCAAVPAAARTEDLKHGQQSPATFEPYPSAGKAPSAAMNAVPCISHDIVAISTQMIAIITRAGDTLENLQDCYIFDSQRTNSENKLLTDTFRAGQIILLFK